MRLLIGFFVLVSCCAVRAQVFFDNTSGDNEWTTPSNWSTDALPLATDNVSIGLGLTASINDGTPVGAIVRVGNNDATFGGAGTLVLDNLNAALSANQIRIGNNDATGGGTLRLINGSMLADAGGTNESLYVGYDANAPGHFIMGDGVSAPSLVYTNGRFEVSRVDNGIGTFDLLSGSVTGHENLIIGQSGGAATMNVSGGSFTTSAAINMNNDAQGFLNISGGAVSSVNFQMASQGAGASTVNISGGSLTINGTLNDRGGSSTIRLSGAGLLDIRGTSAVREVETFNMSGASMLRLELNNASTGLSAPLNILTAGAFSDTPQIDLLESFPAGSPGVTKEIRWTAGNDVWDADGSKWSANTTPSNAFTVATGESFEIINSVNDLTGGAALTLSPGAATDWSLDTSDPKSITIARTGAGIGTPGLALAVLDDAAATLTANSDIRISNTSSNINGIHAARLDLRNGNATFNNHLVLGGDDAGGTVNQAGGSVVITGDLVYGPTAASAQGGVYNLNGGDLTVNGNIVESDVAVNTASLQLNGGTLNLGPASTVTVQRFSVGEANGADVTYTVTRPITTTGTFAVGGNGNAQGTLIIDGASSTVNANNFGIGQNDTSQGTYIQRGGTVNSGAFTVGQNGNGDEAGQGTALIENGTLNISNRLNVGGDGTNDANAQGTVIMGLPGGGGNPTVTVSSQNIEVGRGGKGTFIQHSGLLDQTTNNLVLGQAAAAEGTYVLNGGTFNIANDANVNAGAGTLEVNGGILNIGDGNTGDHLQLGSSGTSVSRVNLNGGEVNVSGGIVFRNNGDDRVTIAGATVSLGEDLNMNGSGIVTVDSGIFNIGDGTGNDDALLSDGATETATFNINGGTVTVSRNLNYRNNGSDIVNLAGGVLDLTGGIVQFGTTGTNEFNFVGGRLADVAAFQGNLEQQGGTLQIGGSIGIMEIQAGASDGSNGDYLFTAGALEIEIDGLAGGGLTGGHDQLIIPQFSSGAVTLGGAGANLQLIVNASLGPGDLNSVFVIIDNEGGNFINGQFGQGSMVTGSDGSVFGINYAGGDGNDVQLTLLSVIPEPSTTGLLLMGLFLAGPCALRRLRRTA